MVASKVIAHDLVLDEVAVEMRRDDALPDRVIPARHVAHERESQSPRRDEERRDLLHLDIAEHDRGAFFSEAVEERMRYVTMRREVPALHCSFENLPAW